MDEAPKLDDSVASYYAEGREQSRLATTSRLEFIRTQELLGRFLPHPPARVLDVGGGPGAHATALMALGYDVVLVDPMQLHVDEARRAGVEQALVGDARRLDFSDNEFDAALLLGPLYHLIEREDRVQAMREARRVVRTQGRVFMAAISRFASMWDGLLRDFSAEREFEEIVEHDLATGVHRNPSRRLGWFTTAYFHRPDELAGEVEAAGLRLEAVVAIEGIGSILTDVDAWIDDRVRREKLLHAIRRVEAEPSLLGVSPHLLVVAAVD